MIAAIYARKSTDQAGVADEQKSVARQIDHARAYAARRGWTVDEACIFVDDGISGAEFATRPGFVRLMASLKPRPPFQILVMSEESRLGREAIETAYALKQLVTAGVRVFFYLEDRERTLDSPTDKIMMSLTAFADELEREKARQRVTDAMTRKARAGHVTGGRVFGYDNVEILAGVDSDGRPRRSHVERRINEDEASVVRRVFELAAAGVGQARIARALNAEGLPSPRSQQGRPRSWATSSVHEVLFRPLYRGEIVWNRTRKRNQWGEKRVVDRPPADWLRREAPELRVVSQDLWLAAHARIASARALYHDATKGLRGGRPRVDSKYLLPGLAQCAWCNGGLHVRTAAHGTRGHQSRVFFYACTSHFNRGPDICANRVRVRMADVDRAVLASIGELLTSDLIDDVIARVRQLWESPRGSDDLERVATDLAAAEAQAANLTEAIAMGGHLPALVKRLQAADARRLELVRQLVSLGKTPVPTRIDWRATERQARALLRDWRSVLGRHTEHARPLLRELLEGRKIRFTPFVEGELRGYRFEGDAGVGGLLAGAASNGSWRPWRDSNPRSSP